MTDLTPGDLALIGYSSDTGGKSFAFVLLRDVDASTTINFTDNGWLAAGGFRGGEGIVTWTAPAGGALAGTVVTFTGLTVTVNPSTSGDQIIAYQGAAATPTNLFALDFADGNATFAADATSSNTSAVPTGLTFGSTALAFALDNGAYTGPTTGTLEALRAAIANPANWTIDDGVPVAYASAFTIAAGATVSVDDVSVTEGDAGATLLTFTVTRAGGTQAFDVSYATANGSADSADYVATNGTLSFADGEMSKTVSVTINGDTDVEGDDTFSLNLSGATGGVTIADGQGIGTITNDDAPDAIIAPWINEFHYDNTGTDTGEFIEIAGPAGLNLTGYTLVLYNGNGGGTYNTRALSGVIADQSNGFGVISFSYPTDGIQNGSPDGIALVGPSGVIEFISYEGPMSATSGPAVGMTSTDVAVTEGSGSGTSIARTGHGFEGSDFGWVLVGDDNPGAVNAGQTFATPVARVRVSDASVTEGDAGTAILTFTITRTGTTQAFSVSYGTADGSATVAGGDYAPTSGVVDFAAGETTKTVQVTV
ncbi:MAG TPA: Calx-beta domain-containing protein, partial [Acidimicrobiia bacterium]|nr:Calx-beta domain-containing protein [Acidimicrobiia bacterium]